MIIMSATHMQKLSEATTGGLSCLVDAMRLSALSSEPRHPFGASASAGASAFSGGGGDKTTIDRSKIHKTKKKVQK